jgi:hypothetical protein
MVWHHAKVLAARSCWLLSPPPYSNTRLTGTPAIGAPAMHHDSVTLGLGCWFRTAVAYKQGRDPKLEGLSGSNWLQHMCMVGANNGRRKVSGRWRTCWRASV